MSKCFKCGKETNRIVPDFNLNTETYKIDMQFICEDCFNKRYEDLKQYFNRVKEKILIFLTQNSRDYWFNYIVSSLKKTSLFFKVKKSEKEIWLENERIMFKTYYEINEKFKAGRRNQFIIYYKNMENRLEDNFKETLKEILLDGESRD